MMVEVISWNVLFSLHLLRYFLDHVFTLNAFTFRPTLHSHVVTFTIFFETVTFEAFTLDPDGNRLTKQLFTISTIPALALRAACLTKFETFAIIFKAACFHAGAFTHYWRF
jgi:hypothetical protein